MVWPTLTTFCYDLAQVVRRSHMSSTPIRLPGLDYGRAIAAVFVLLWHEHIFGLGRLFSPEATAPFLPTIVDVLNANVLLQAVPFFVFMSCYLYARNGPSRSSLKRRTARLTTLHIFWGVTYFLVMGGIPALSEALSVFLTRPIYATFTAMGSFYFFSALLVSVALTHLALKLSSSALIAAACAGALAITTMQVATVQYGVLWASAFWSPLNYVLIAPAAVLLARRLGDRPATAALSASLVAAFVGVAAAEWAFLVHPEFTRAQGYAIPAYTRISPALFCSAAICLLLTIRRPAGPVISFMSRFALAAYCLQAFVLAFSGELGLPLIPKAAFDLGVTYALAYLLGRFVFKNHLLEAGGLPLSDRHQGTT